MKAYFKGDKDVLVFEPIPQSKRGRPKKDVPGRNAAKTNADRIRSMSDERLVELLSKPWCENHRLPEECARFDTDCEACVMDWLKQPYGGSDVLE
jgi:hypothetical protein